MVTVIPVAGNPILQRLVTGMKLSLSQAAKEAGVSKPTLSRWVKKGKISAERQDDGSYQIDVSELDRIRDLLKSGNRSGNPDMKRSETHNEKSVLQAEIGLLRERLSDKDQRLHEKDDVIEDLREDRDRWRTQAEQAGRLLTDQRPETERTKRLEAELAELRGHREELGKELEEQGRRLQELEQKPKRRSWWQWGRS
jgi:excisionase family DNA binding protein